MLYPNHLLLIRSEIRYLGSYDNKDFYLTKNNYIVEVYGSNDNNNNIYSFRDLLQNVKSEPAYGALNKADVIFGFLLDRAAIMTG